MLDLDNEVLRPLREGAFKLDCTNILLDGRYHGKSVTFSGPGYIEQSPDKGFNATIFVKGSPQDAPGNDGQICGLPGTLVSSEGVLKLEATDLRGQKWLAENIWRPGSDGCVPGDRYVVRCSFHELLVECSQPSAITMAGEADLELFIRGSVHLPLSNGKSIELRGWAEDGGASTPRVTKLIAVTFQAGNLEFELFNHAGWFHLRAKGNVDQPNIISRVYEALLFSLATPESWSVAAVSKCGKQQTRVRSPRKQLFDAGQWPPILFRSSPPIENFWQLFCLYLEYAFQEKEKPLHPLSAQVLAVSRSGGASLEAQTLALVVAVEAIVNRFYADIANPTDAHRGDVGNLIKHIKNWNGNERIRVRAVGAVGSISRARASDRLESLVQKGAVSEPGTRLWKKLRDQAAHGDWSKLHDSLQAHIDQMGAVRTLFYQLIFHLIGYTGLQTDYGTHGYPILFGTGCAGNSDAYANEKVAKI